MKRFFLFLLGIISCHLLTAQNIDTAKSLLKSKKLLEAKKEIDAAVPLPKYLKYAETYYVKAKVYNAIAMDPVLSKQFPGSRMEAFQAIKKYTEMDKNMLSLQIDGYQPINQVYTGYYQDAATDFNAKEYAKALDGFANAIKVSSFMNEKGWIKMPVDTNSILYAGVAAEKVKQDGKAAEYYGMLIDARAKGEGFIEIYKWVANYYYEKKDMALANRYLLTGKEVYPADPFWISLELDITREKGNSAELFALYDKIIKAETANYLYRYNYAVELYQAGYNSDRSKRPVNSTALMSKAEEQIKETTRIAPTYTKAWLFAGQIIYNYGVDLLDDATKAMEEGKKVGFKTSALQKFKEAIPYLLKAEEQLSTIKPLKGRDKDDLKETLDILSTIYDQTGDQVKVKEYQQKFNAIDKN